MRLYQKFRTNFYIPGNGFCFITASSSAAMSAIQAGFNEWTQKTCIRFKKRTNEADYVSFFRGSGYVYVT